MGSSVALFTFVLYFGCSVIRTEFSPEHEGVSPENFIQEDIAINKHAAGPAIEIFQKFCPSGFGCGFQIYNGVTREPSYPFIKYCSCPENTHCVQVGDNVLQQFYYYKCEDVLGHDVQMPPHASTPAELPDILESEEMESVQEDNSPVSVNPIYTTTESTDGPSLDEITEHVVYAGFNEESTNPKQNLENYEVESSDIKNSDEQMPEHFSSASELHTIYVTSESTVGPSLDETTESLVAYPGTYEGPGTNIGRSFGATELSDSDPEISSRKAETLQEMENFDGANFLASETDYSTSREQTLHVINSSVAESSDTAEAIRVTSTDAVVAGNTHNSSKSLDSLDSDTESINLLQNMNVNTTLEILHFQDEL